MTEERYNEIHQMVMADVCHDEIECAKGTKLMLQLSHVASVKAELLNAPNESIGSSTYIILIAAQQHIPVSRDLVPFGLDFSEYAEYLGEWSKLHPVRKSVGIKNLRGIY